MIDTSQIQNEKLRKLIEKSAKFKALPEKEKAEYLEAIKMIPNPQEIKKIHDSFKNLKMEDEEEEQKFLKAKIKELNDLNQQAKIAIKKLNNLKLREEEKENEVMDSIEAEDLLAELDNK